MNINFILLNSKELYVGRNVFFVFFENEFNLDMVLYGTSCS